MAMIEKHYAKFIIADRRRYAELAAVDIRTDDDTAKVVALR